MGESPIESFWLEKLEAPKQQRGGGETHSEQRGLDQLESAFHVLSTKYFKFIPFINRENPAVFDHMVALYTACTADQSAYYG